MKLRKWSITLIGCALVFGALTAFKVMEIRAAIAFGESYPEPAETVEEARVTSAEYVPTITVIGELVAPQRLDLRNELPGEIMAVNFESGAKVEKGQLLMQLDTTVEQANLEAAKAREQLAQLAYTRVKDLLETGATNQEQVDRARADLATATAAITILQRAIDKKTLRAPFAGRAGLHNFEVGQYLESNTVITTLIGDKDFIWVDFRVPQFYPRLAVEQTVSVEAINDNLDKHAGQATVIAENTILNPGNRSRAYRARIPNQNRYYAANTMIEVEVPIGVAQQVLQVPAISVQSDPLGQYVFVLREDSENDAYRAVRQRVKIITIAGNVAFLENDNLDKGDLDKESGLTEGMLIAGPGAFKLYDGILVHVRDRQQNQAYRFSSPAVLAFNEVANGAVR